MAIKQQVSLIDDMDPSGQTIADETVPFGFRGRQYEIDLATVNAKAFEEAVAPYISAARTVTVSRGGRDRSPQQRERSALCRAWLKSRGEEVPERGRIPKKLIEKWEAAGSPHVSSPQLLG
jgi:hypothetical protein